MKILHKYNSCNAFLNTFKPDVSQLCCFCSGQDESILHLFYRSTFLRKFWADVLTQIFTFHNKLVHISEEMVLFLNSNTGCIVIDITITLLCLLGKFHIHKARILHSKPNFNLFLFELKYYLNLFLNYTTKKQLKLQNILDKICSDTD